MRAHSFLCQMGLVLGLVALATSCTVDVTKKDGQTTATTSSSLTSASEKQLIQQCQQGDQAACTKVKQMDAKEDASNAEAVRMSSLGNYKGNHQYEPNAIPY